MEFKLSYKMLFTVLKYSKLFLRNSQSKLEATIGFLWKAKTKIAKKNYFIKNLFSPTPFKINTSNFKRIF